MLVFAGYVKRFLLCTILCRPIGTSKIKVFSCILTLSCGGQILWYNVGLATHNQRILTVNVNVDAAPVVSQIPAGMWELAEIFFFIIGACACIRACRWATAPIGRPDKEEQGNPRKREK